MKLLFLFMILLLAACAAHHAPKSDIWIVSKARGLSFQVEGRKNWYRLEQGDSAVKAGDTIYINYPGHEKDGAVTQWHTRRKHKGGKNFSHQNISQLKALTYEMATLTWRLE